MTRFFFILLLLSSVVRSQTITTIAGTGTAGYSGDNASAQLAELHNPYEVVFDTSGNLYFSDLSNNTIRKINLSGVITTIAGTGTSGYSGDNSAAITAELNFPIGLAIDKFGNLFIAD